MVHGICKFCQEEKELTFQHIAAAAYGGEKTSQNGFLPCRLCHDRLENEMNKRRSHAGAGLPILPVEYENIGQKKIAYITGSCYLPSGAWLSFESNTGSIYGARVHQNQSGEHYIRTHLTKPNNIRLQHELSGAAWIIYSIATDPYV